MHVNVNQKTDSELWNSKTVTKFYSDRFLADRTNGCAYATMLRLSVWSVFNVCIVAKRCVLEQKVTIDSQSYNKESIKMNDLDLCIEVV